MSWKAIGILKMKCDNCDNESQWLESIGTEYICRKCIGKNKNIGLILKTHMDTFNFLIRNLKIKNFEELINVKREEIEKAIDLKKYGIVLKKEN